MRRTAFLLAATLLLAGCGGGKKAREPLPQARGTLALSSPAFAQGATIPPRYTCDGVSPPLSWSGVPRAARELVLVVEDVDAGGFIHWTMLGISPRQRGLAEAAVPPGAVETDNSFGKRGWGAPCPPKGDSPHRYIFALYATDARLVLDASAAPDDVRTQLARHALARGTLTGRFGRR